MSLEFAHILEKTEKNDHMLMMCLVLHFFIKLKVARTSFKFTVIFNVKVFSFLTFKYISQEYF